jgi:pimeloyl-ACP methyl ester carboxylesterase
MNESTNFTVLMPDLRGHGENPSVQNASFGGCEGEDVRSAVAFLRSLKGGAQSPLVGRDLGIFGVEMGSIAALTAAVNDPAFKAVALDSVPQDSDSVLKGSINKRFPFASFATAKLASLGTRLYYFDGCYDRVTACDTARKLDNRKVLLLAGVDAPDFQESTSKLNKCFANGSNIDSKTDLSPSGFSINKASIEQSELYDQRVIDFFRNSLSPAS